MTLLESSPPSSTILFELGAAELKHKAVSTNKACILGAGTRFGSAFRVPLKTVPDLVRKLRTSVRPRSFSRHWSEPRCPRSEPKPPGSRLLCASPAVPARTPRPPWEKAWRQALRGSQRQLNLPEL